MLFSSVETSFMNLLAAGSFTPLRCRARGLFFDTVVGPPMYFYSNSTSGKEESAELKTAKGFLVYYFMILPFYDFNVIERLNVQMKECLFRAC